MAPKRCLLALLLITLGLGAPQAYSDEKQPESDERNEVGTSGDARHEVDTAEDERRKVGTAGDERREVDDAEERKRVD